ncbi:TPA: PBSX family phage terminase large subunit, partial [Pseudomonas aeruginosa]
VYNLAKMKGASVTYDSIGVGAHVGSKFAELNDSSPDFKLTYDPFNAGGAVDKPDDIYMKLPHTTIKNKDHFSNIKAQKWEEVATRFRKTYEAVVHGKVHPFDELISIN